jgi:hypothetical protein
MAIKTPKNSSKKNEKKGYNIELKWNDNYFNEVNAKLKRVLLGVSEYSKNVMNDKYVPKNTGTLINSAEIAILSDDTADIKWEAPYASEIYYDKSRTLKGKRGPVWFDRMFEEYRSRIEKEANRIYKG